MADPTYSYTPYLTALGVTPRSYRDLTKVIDGNVTVRWPISAPADAQGNALWGDGDKPVTAALFAALKAVTEQLRDGLTKTMTGVIIPDAATGGTVTRVAADGTTTTETVAASGSVQALAANSARRFLSLLNVDTGQARYGYSSSFVAAGKGTPLDAAAASGVAGGGYEELQPHKGAIFIASTGPTTLIIVEG